jgi:Fe-S cluster assembly ATPase SufC
MITRLYADNYRCLANFECALETEQLILGPNGAGKSAIFDVLMLIRDFCALGQPRDDDFVGSTRTRWQDVAEQRFEFDVRGGGGTFAFKLVVDSWGNPARPRVVDESVTFDGQPVFRFALGEVHLFDDRHEEKVKYPFDWHRSALATITERPENTKLTWFKRWLSRLLCIRPDPWGMSSVASTEAKWPTSSLSNFADWYRHLRQERSDHEHEEYAAAMREVLEGLVGIRLEEAGERKREIKLLMAPTDSDDGKRRAQEYLFEELSDGQRVLLGLYAVLHFALKDESTVCFDEPDNFLALAEIQPWLQSLSERAAETRSQVLIVSHNPELLNSMAFGQGLHFDRPNARHVRVRRFDDAAATGLSPAELVARGWERD